MVLAVGSHDHAYPRYITYNDIKKIIMRANVDEHAVHTARVVKKITQSSKVCASVPAVCLYSDYL